MKEVNGKIYVHTPELEKNSCTGCVAQDSGYGCDLALCELIRDDNYCLRNGGMIYKEQVDERDCNV